jgi:hypothetical protein
MNTKGLFRCVIAAGIFCGMFSAGCEQQAKKAAPAAAEPSNAVKIALRSAVGDQTTYKMITQVRRTTKWQGPVPDKATFGDNFNEERVEMVFKQQVQSVDSNGVTVAKITIDGLKIFNSTKDSASVDFDSLRKTDANSPLMKLIGEDYLIEYNPSNNISAIDDLPPVTTVMKGETPSDRAGINLVLPEILMDKHGAFALPQAGGEMLKPGAKWTKIKTFPFGKMGLKSYEKIYTLEKVQEIGGRKIAVIDMNAIPTSEVEPRYINQKAEVGVPKMFDTNDSYTGGGEIDVKLGRIENYHENFRASWFVALPPKANDTGEPVVLNMIATRVYSLERVK